MTLSHLDAILQYISREGYAHRDNVPILLSDYFSRNPRCSPDEFTKFVISIRSDFFRINRINRQDFAREVYQIISKISQPPEMVVEEGESLIEKIDTLIEATEQNRTEHRIMDTKLDEILQSHLTQIQLSLESIIDILIQFTQDFQEVKAISSSQVIQSIRQRITLSKQESQLELMQRMDKKLSLVLQELQKDNSKARRLLNVIKDVGADIVSEVFATVLLRMAGIS